MSETYEQARDRSLLLCGQSLGHPAKVSSENLGPSRARPVLRAQGSDKSARAMTLFLQALVNQQLEGAGAFAPLAARIKFGQAGAQGSLDVDVSTGTIITIPASFVEVQAYCLADVVTEAAPFEFSEIEVVGAIVEGSRSGGARPTLTHRFTLGGAPAGPNASVVIPVPPYAKEWLIVTTDDPNPLVDWSFLGGTVTGTLEISGGDPADLLYANTAGTPPKVPGHARALELTNSTGDAHSYTLTWFLEV